MEKDPEGCSYGNCDAGTKCDWCATNLGSYSWKTTENKHEIPWPGRQYITLDPMLAALKQSGLTREKARQYIDAGLPIPGFSFVKMSPPPPTHRRADEEHMLETEGAEEISNLPFDGDNDMPELVESPDPEIQHAMTQEEAQIAGHRGTYSLVHKTAPLPTKYTWYSEPVKYGLAGHNPERSIDGPPFDEDTLLAAKLWADDQQMLAQIGEPKTKDRGE